MGQAFAVCSQIVEEGICSMEDVDRGAKVGLRWTMGPFELANSIGVAEASRMATEYANMAGLELPVWFSGRSESFDFSYVDVDIDETGIATVLINRPEAMNAPLFVQNQNLTINLFYMGFSILFIIPSS